MSVVLIFDICNVYEIVKIGCICSIVVGCKDGRYGFEISQEHGILGLFLAWRYKTKLYYYISMFLVW